MKSEKNMVRAMGSPFLLAGAGPAFLVTFSALQTIGLRSQFLAGCHLQSTLSSQSSDPLHNQLKIWQFASSLKPARKNVFWQDWCHNLI